MTTKTGVFMTHDELEEIKGMLQPTLQMDLDTNITITNPPDKAGAVRRVNELAIQHGLPELPNNANYGVDANREFVTSD